MVDGRATEDRPENWIVDFLNLLLGKSKETDDFWKDELLPRAAQHFNFPLSDL